MGRFKKLAFAIPVMASALVAVPVTSANATPSGCSAQAFYNTRPETGKAICHWDSGHYRALIYCTADPNLGYGVYATGPWLLAGSNVYSQAVCPSGHPYIVDAGYDLAPW
jgi:hypothetical protein